METLIVTFICCIRLSHIISITNKDNLWLVWICNDVTKISGKHLILQLTPLKNYFSSEVKCFKWDKYSSLSLLQILPSEGPLVKFVWDLICLSVRCHQISNINQFVNLDCSIISEVPYVFCGPKQIWLSLNSSHLCWSNGQERVPLSKHCFTYSFSCYIWRAGTLYIWVLSPVSDTND